MYIFKWLKKNKNLVFFAIQPLGHYVGGSIFIVQPLGRYVRGSIFIVQPLGRVVRTSFCIVQVLGHQFPLEFLYFRCYALCFRQ